MFTLTRSLGGAIGISVIQAMTIRDTAAAQSRLVEHVRPDSPLVAWRMPGFDPGQHETLVAAMEQVARQATMVAYVDTFRALFLFSLAMAPMCLLMRGARAGSGMRATPVHME